jgi:hypothetical protein
MCRSRVSWIAVATLILLGGWPLVAACAQDGASHEFGEHNWELTSYLKGTTSQVRDRLNSEVERLTARVKGAQRELDDARSDVKSDEKAAVARVKKTSPYVQNETEMKKAQGDLEQARAGGTPQQRVDASSRFNKHRLALEKMEREAVLNDKTLDQDHRRVRELEKDLARFNDSLAKATKWRQELLDAIRVGFCIKGPVKTNSHGTLGKVMVKKIIDPHKAVVLYDAPELLDRGKDHEEIATFSAKIQTLELTVSGIDASGMKAGEPTYLDQNFVITKSGEEGNETYTARAKPSDVDELFAAIVPLRDEPAEEGAKASTTTRPSKASPF